MIKSSRRQLTVETNSELFHGLTRTEITLSKHGKLSVHATSFKIFKKLQFRMRIERDVLTELSEYDQEP